MKTQWLSYLMLFFSLFALALMIYRRRIRKNLKPQMNADTRG